MGKWSTYALGVDLSGYNQVTDWKTLGQNVDFVIAKASEGEDILDPGFAAICDGAYHAGLPFAAYHYFKVKYYAQFPFPSNEDVVKNHWPDANHDLQLQNFLHALQNKTYNAVALDIEETGNTGYSDGWISNSSRILAGRIWDWLQANRPDTPLYIYTRNTYISEFAPGLNNWIANYPSWICAPYWARGLEPVTWDNLKANKLPPDDYSFGYFSTRPNWDLVQWSIDRFHPSGINGAVDFNFFNGDKDALVKAWKYTPPPPPPTYSMYQVEAPAGLRVHAAAQFASAQVGLLADGTVFKGYETKDEETPDTHYLWVRCDTGWACMEYDHPVNLLKKL